jgi:octaprenyl-diphosphate synthase
MISQTRLMPEHAQGLLSAVYAPIAGELAEAERIFASELGSRLPFVQHLVEHCAHLRGKRLRPALVLLTAKACGGVQPAHPVLAAVVEMIHTATLVHDDVLDLAVIRRHAATVNAEWGNETAVLMGDYLFTHAFHLAASLDSTLACRWIGRATNLVCEGEMQQVHNRGNLDLDEAAYLSIVRGKTAELTAVSCRLGAHYAGASEETVEALASFGRDLGVAFQITDDVLDLWGEERTTGKTLGTDLEQQKLTLPLIRLMRTVPATTAEAIRSLLTDPQADRRGELRPYLGASGSLDYAWDCAQQFANRAASALDILPDSTAKSLLGSLATLIVRRSA